METEIMDMCDFQSWLLRMADLMKEASKLSEGTEQFYLNVGREEAYRNAAEKIKEVRS